MMHQWDTAGTALNVVVTTRLIQVSTCTGTCSFTHNTQANSPALTAISRTSVTADTVTLTGTALNNGPCDVVLTNQADSTAYTLTASTCTATSAITAVNTAASAVTSGKYWAQVKTNTGYTNRLELSVLWNLGTIVTGQSTAGSFVTISNAKGWPATLDDKIFSITLTSSTQAYLLNVASCCSGGNAEI